MSESMRELDQKELMNQVATLRRKNEELERANEAKNRLLANMNHELRTPLNAVIGFTGTLLMKLPGPLTAEQENQLRILQAGGRQLVSILNDIRDLTRIEAGRFDLRLGPVEVRSVIHEAAATLRPLAEAKGLRFELVLPEQDVGIHSDREALVRIVLNLAANAVKFTNQGFVGIALERRDVSSESATEIRVSDSGPGIREEDRARLFQVFEHVEGMRIQGIGLGPHLAGKLAELLGGRILVQSRIGVGSTFTVELPSQQGEG